MPNCKFDRLVICTLKPGHLTERDFGIREVAKLHQIPYSVVISWLKAFRERGEYKIALYSVSTTEKREVKDEKEIV